MEKNIKILVAAHKADPNIKSDDIYMPIHVGKALHPEVDLGFQGDDTGDNISEKNGSYCELTAMYWAWKNLKNVDIIGLAHYRRYLKLDVKKYLSFLNDGGIILPYPYHERFNNFSNLAFLLTHEEATIAVDLLLKVFPDSKCIVRDYFWRSNKYSVYNMFIMNWKIFDEYCGFLFNYLEKLEKILKKNSYIRLQRNIGYISEVLLGFWVRYKNLRVKYVKTQDFSKKSRGNIRDKLINLHRDIGFHYLFLPSRQKIKFYSATVNSLRNQDYNINDYE